MPQTTYSLDLDRATAGQIVARYPGGMRGVHETSEDVDPGLLVEYHSDGKLRKPAGTTLTKCVGAIPYQATKQSAPWTSSDGPAPVLRKGQVWLKYSGTAPTVESSVNVRHASDDTNSEAQYRGTVTGSATSAVAGSEISAIEGAKCLDVDTSLGLALVELNFPA